MCIILLLFVAFVRPGFWTIHPTFSNNVRVTGLDIYTYGHNTDGIDPDSAWNVYIANNSISTGDDCIAVKSGYDLVFDNLSLFATVVA